MVDRRERRDLQDGKGKDRQSKCHVHHQRRGLGRDVDWETQRHVGLYDWPAESPRQPSGGEKTRRDLPLKFRLDLELDEGCRPRSGARFSPEEIKVPLDRTAAAERDLKRLEAGVAHLYSGTILAVLNPCVMHLQLPLGSYDIIGTVTFVKKITKYADFPVVSRVINQGRFWEDAFETEPVREKPDDTTAGGDYRILIDREAHADHGKDFVFHERKRDEGLGRYVERAGDIVLEIGPRIDLDTRAGMIMHYIFKSQLSMHSLEMVGQTIISAAEIKSLVFNACAEIPFTGDEEAMRVTNIIVERVAVTEIASDVVEIAVERVVHLIIKQIKVVAFRWRWRRLHLIGRCARKHGRRGA